MDILGIYSMVAQSLNGALEEIELDGDNCHYQKIMMMESLREIEKWFLKFNDIFMEKILDCLQMQQVRNSAESSKIYRSAYHGTNPSVRCSC